MNFRTTLFATAFLITTSAIPLHALPVTFDLRDTTATTEIESGIITRSGLTATLTPHVSGTNGVLNQTAGGFGINADGSDASSEIDDAQGAEWISITFDKDVYLTGLKLSDFSTTEHALLEIGSYSPLSLTGLAPADDVYTFNSNNSLLVGQSLLVKFSDGNGFSFDSFTVDPILRSSVPDTLPFTFTACFLLGSLTLFHRLSAARTPATRKIRRH